MVENRYQSMIDSLIRHFDHNCLLKYYRNPYSQTKSLNPARTGPVAIDEGYGHIINHFLIGN